MAAAFRLITFSLPSGLRNKTSYTLLQLFLNFLKTYEILGTVLIWVSCKDLKRVSTSRWHPSNMTANSSCINKAVMCAHGPHVFFDDIAFEKCVALGEKKHLGKDDSMLNVSLYSLFYRRWDEHCGAYKLAEQYRKIQFNHMKLFYSKDRKIMYRKYLQHWRTRSTADIK